MGSELTEDKLVAFSKKLGTAFNQQKTSLIILQGMIEKQSTDLKEQYATVLAFDKSCNKALDDKLEGLRSAKPNKVVSDATVCAGIVDIYMQKLSSVSLSGPIKSVKVSVDKLEGELGDIKKSLKTLIKDAGGANAAGAVAAFNKAYKKHSWSNLKSGCLTTIKAEYTQFAAENKADHSACVTHLKKFEKVATESFIKAIPLLIAKDTPKGKAIVSKIAEVVAEIKTLNKNIASSSYSKILAKDILVDVNKGIVFLESHL